ncbi:MAG TPA: ABC transporter permease subunit [Minicystis sp.]|nr:ABC transporter permease subunit [Minicystis sp.]
MLRYAFRRLLWLVPTLVGVSILSFWFLSYVPDPTDDPFVRRTASPLDLARMRRERFLDLPRFVNVAPRDVDVLADLAIARVAGGGPDAEEGRRELVRLGGAALPRVIPALDALEPERRGSVAVALAPIAWRMRLPAADEATDPARAAAFWARFWQDRGIEFRRAAVRSDVSRLLRYRAAETADDVRQVDTYALRDLFAALRLPDDAGSLDRARTLVGVISDVTGRGDRIDPGDGLEVGRACVERWLVWWSVYATDYVELQGPSRIAAMLTETRYGKWALGAIAYRFGTSSSGKPVLDELAARAPVTIFVLFGAIALAYALAIPLGALAALHRGRRADLAVAFVALGLYAVPTAVVAVVVARATGGAPGSLLLATSLLAVGLVASPTRQLRSSLAGALSQDFVRAALARGAGRARAVAVHALRHALLPIATLAMLEAPMALGGAFVVERVFDLRGVGELTIRAVQVRDTSWLMALAIVAATIAALFVLATDLGYVLLDPRLERGVVARRGRP